MLGDANSRAVKRIEDVRSLRATQFPEDGGPMAHPVRPDSYQEISNFYTATVYEKGAEVVRMLQTLVGVEGFRRGMDLYFKRHDGQAVTCDDFVAAIADANGRDLTQFKRWYSQAGTPRVMVDSRYDAHAYAFELTLSQSTPPTPGQASKEPFHIPFAVGLVAGDGRDMPLQLEGESTSASATKVLNLRRRSRRFDLSTSASGRCRRCCAIFRRRSSSSIVTATPSLRSCRRTIPMPSIGGKPGSVWRLQG